MSAAERASLEDEARACAAEIVSPGTSRIGKARAAVAKLARGITGAVVKTFRRENIDAALDGSAAFAKLVTKYGVDAAREAVIRRVRRGVEDKIGAVIGGDGAKVR